ncbi:MAG TPA: hypothetical protein V6D07_18340 [Trichocoleus sp.]
MGNVSPKPGWTVPLSGAGLFLAVSLGLHGVLLTLPLASPPEAETELIEPESLAVTVLPAAPVAKPEVTPPASSSSPPKVAPAPVQPTQMRPTPQPAPQPQRQPVAETPSPKADEQPRKDPEPAPPEPTPEAETPPVPYQDFPHLAEATAGCQGLSEGLPDCWRSPASNWRAASRALREQLEDQGYVLEDITDKIVSEDTGVRIYEAARNGNPEYYLHLISVDGGLLYALAQERFTENEIAAIKGGNAIAAVESD